MVFGLFKRKENFDFQKAAQEGCSVCPKNGDAGADHATCPASQTFAALSEAIGFVNGAKKMLSSKNLTPEQREQAEFESRLDPARPEHLRYIQSELANIRNTNG